MKEIIYQMLPRLWGDGKLACVDDATLSYLNGLGVSALWLTGIPRHATGKPFVKGNPGSPYAISDYYDVNPYLADRPERRMEEFRAMVKRVHAHGLKLFIDLVPNHVAPDYADSHGGIPVHDWHDYDWSDTVKINYDDPRAVRAVTDIVLYWASKGVDGFRCDMVELVPVRALGEIITAAKKAFPGLTFIGEAYDMANYRPLLDAGFDFLYDKSGMYDSLFAIVRGNMGRFDGDCSANRLTRGWQALGDIRPRMLDFLENHDEVRFCSPDYAGTASASADESAGATTALLYERAPLAVAALLTEGPFMLYFGQEIGITASESENCRTSIFNWSSPAELHSLWNHVHNAPASAKEQTQPAGVSTGTGLDGSQEKCLEMFREILSLARKLSDFPMFDLCYCQSSGFDDGRHFAFLRGRTLVFCNFGADDAMLYLVIPPAAADLNGVKESPVRIDCRAFGIEVLELPAR